jgi:hypothetical protein
LFEQWFSHDAVVRLKLVLCENCGFVFYLPRPESDDIDNKYYFLNSLASEEEGHALSPTAPTELKRANLLKKYLAGQVNLASVDSILDFGGHDGRLMHPFIEAGKTCYLVDYTPQSVPG